MVLQDISIILLTKLLVNQITYYMKYYEPNLTPPLALILNSVLNYFPVMNTLNLLNLTLLTGFVKISAIF